MNVITVCSKDTGNTYFVAETISSCLNCPLIIITPNFSLKNYDHIIWVCQNIGDEELPEPLELYLLSLKLTDKFYSICELGNDFGLGGEFFGCGKIVRNVLSKLQWTELSKISIDSFPELDMVKLSQWLNLMMKNS